MWRKFFVFGTLVCLVQSSFAQKLFFARENYTDSLLFQKNIKNLARQAILLYKEPNSEKFYDNVFRLQIVAEDYSAVEGSITQFAQFAFGDTINTKALAFPFKLYNTTLAKKPSKADFNSVYEQVFTDSYQSLSADGKSWAAQYFDNNLSDMQAAFDKRKEEYSGVDSLTVAQAVALCRSYCSVVCYSSTVSLAKSLLKKIEDDDYIKQDSVLIKLSDGATISLTIVRSKKISTPQPVVLMFDIYSTKDMSGRCKDMASKGYVGIIADTRGKRLSGDVIEPFEHDAKDAYEIIDWISKQSWCNGKVGMYGGSYLGFSQWSAAKYLHPALKTIVPQVAVAPGVEFPSHNGIFMGYMLMWIYMVTNDKLNDNKVFGDMEKWFNLFTQWYKNGTRFRSLDSAYGKPSPIFQRWLNHPTYDAYWQKMTPQKEEFAKLNIPILTITGYWDVDQVGAMYYYQQHQKFYKNNQHYLLIGPYDHSGAQGYPKRTLGGYTIDSVANIPIMDLVFQWFDHQLKDSARPSILKEKVNFQLMGRNEWMHTSSIEKMSNDTLQWYMGNRSERVESVLWYPLLKSQPGKNEFIQQTVNLKDRTDLQVKLEDLSAEPSIIDTVLNYPGHQLVFRSEPMEKPLVISGAVTASITASINKRDMDVVFNLYELTTEGKYLLLANNWQRASYAKDRSQRNLLVPGKIQTFEVHPAYITCRQLQKGSRLVVVFGINKSPQWQINYGTGKDVSEETINDAAEPMQIKWYSTSCIKIPILQ